MHNISDVRRTVLTRIGSVGFHAAQFFMESATEAFNGTTDTDVNVALGSINTAPFLYCSNLQQTCVFCDGLYVDGVVAGRIFTELLPHHVFVPLAPEDTLCGPVHEDPSELMYLNDSSSV